MEKVLWLALIVLFSEIHQLDCDSLEFDYHYFYMGQDCTMLGFNYIGSNCSPRTFILQSFSLNDVLSNNLQSPKMSLISSSGRFSFLTRDVQDMQLYFRVIANSSSQVTCETDYSTQFYNFTQVLQDGMRSLCFAPQVTSLCLIVPERSPIFVWPISTRSSDGYNYCNTNALLFPLCHTSSSIYQFTINADSDQCLQMDSEVDDGLVKVYYLFDTTPCSSYQCFIASIIAVYQIQLKSSCENQTIEVRARTRNFLQYSTNFYTARLTEDNIAPTLHINVTVQHTHPPQQLQWIKNGEVIVPSEDSRISINSGGLTITLLEPSDAGVYKVITIISNELGCESAQFVVQVEYAVITNSSVSSSDENGTVISCSAMGYPGIQLWWWNNENKNATFSETFSANSTFVSSSLVLIEEEQCGQSWGVTCAISNGGFPPVTVEMFIQCPPGTPGIPLIEYSSTNGTICFQSFSHPEYPSIYYSVSITQMQQADRITTSSLNVSDCLLNYSILCGTFQIDVVAINQLGVSKHNAKQFSDDISCPINTPTTRSPHENSQFFQVCLVGMMNCREWINDEYELPLSTIITEYVQDQCDCNATLIGSVLSCLDNNIITFSASISSLNAVHEIIQLWVASQVYITIGDNTLNVDKQVNCSGHTTVSHSVSMTIHYVIAGFVLVAIFGIVVVLFAIFYLKRRKHDVAISNNQHQSSAYYEEITEIEMTTIQSIPIYEEILSNVDKKSARGNRGNEICDKGEVITNSEFTLTKCPAYAKCARYPADSIV